MPLENYRKEIDAIDFQIVDLFLKRMDIVKNVATYKVEHNMQVLQPEREEALLEKHTEGLSLTNAKQIKTLYTEIMRISRALQQEIIDKK